MKDKTEQFAIECVKRSMLHCPLALPDVPYTRACLMIGPSRCRPLRRCFANPSSPSPRSHPHPRGHPLKTESSPQERPRCARRGAVSRVRAQVSNRPLAPLGCANSPLIDPLVWWVEAQRCTRSEMTQKRNPSWDPNMLRAH